MSGQGAEPGAVDAAVIARAAETLHAGGLVVMPTETVYGLAANALDAKACEKIFELKGRPHNDPLIVHVRSLEAGGEVGRWDRAGPLRRLAEAFWPGPLTVVLERLPSVPDVVTSGLPTVAVRCPAHPVARALLEAARLPLAAPSANRFGRISPTTAAAVRAEFGERTPLLLDGGPCRGGLESTIVRWRADEGLVEVLRPGLVGAEEIAAVCERRVVLAERSREVLAPGMLDSHYAPGKPLLILREDWREADGADLGALVVAGADAVGGAYPERAGWILQRPAGVRGARRIVLSTAGDAREAAANLYAAMRALDEDPSVAFLLAELAAPAGVGDAINDRLRRAAVKRL